MKYIDALFVDGVFRPTEPIELEPGTRVLLSCAEISQPVTTPNRTPEQLSKLELDILDAVHSAIRRGLDEIVDSVNSRLSAKRKDSKTKLQEVTRKQVERGLRSLIDAGYVQVAPPPATADVYRVTPKGKVTEVHRERTRWSVYERRPGLALPQFEDIGPFYEDLDIGFLDLDTRTHNTLKDHGILTVGDVLRLGGKGLRQLHGIGRKGIESLEYELVTMGLRLKDAKYFGR